MGATPFSLAYGVEAVIPVETIIPTAPRRNKTMKCSTLNLIPLMKNVKKRPFELTHINKKRPSITTKMSEQEPSKLANRYSGKFSNIQRKVAQENWEQIGKDHTKSLK